MMGEGAQSPSAGGSRRDTLRGFVLLAMFVLLSSYWFTVHLGSARAVVVANAAGWSILAFIWGALPEAMREKLGGDLADLLGRPRARHVMGTALLVAIGVSLGYSSVHVTLAPGEINRDTQIWITDRDYYGLSDGELDGLAPHRLNRHTVPIRRGAFTFANSPFATTPHYRLRRRARVTPFLPLRYVLPDDFEPRVALVILPHLDFFRLIEERAYSS